MNENGNSDNLTENGTLTGTETNNDMADNEPVPMTNIDNEIDIFSEDPDTLKQISKFVEEILTELMKNDK